MNKKMSALNINGTNSKVVAKEVFNSLYELTKEGANPKKVSDKDREMLLDIDVTKITRSLLVQLFADTTDCSKGNSVKISKAKYNTWDTFNIPANHFYDGQPVIKSTIGRFIVNKFILLGSGVIAVTKYQDSIWNKSKAGDIDDMIARVYAQNKINRKMFNSYVDRRDNLGYWANGMLAHTISEKMLKPIDAVEKKKAELCKKYEAELAAGNIDVMTAISDELVAYAKEQLKGDPGMDLYDSGDLDFGNNYKNNSILKGAVVNKLTNEFDFIASSFMNGIEIKDIPAHANSILASQYPSSIATADAGYLGKKLIALLQMCEVDEHGTDCGTKRLIPLTVTPNNKKDVLYTWFDNNGQLTLLTEENISQYIGKTIMTRSPMTCLNQKICSKCAGELFYMLEVKHAGLFITQLSHADLNLALKAKHNSLINLFTLNPDSLISDI